MVARCVLSFFGLVSPTRIGRGDEGKGEEDCKGDELVFHEFANTRDAVYELYEQILRELGS